MKNKHPKIRAKEALNFFNQRVAEFQRDLIISNSASGYRATIAEVLGCDELVGPIERTQEGIKYTFDFLHPNSDCAFKIFSAQNLAEYEKYLAYPGKKTILVNVQNSYWDQSQIIDSENTLLTLPGENEKQIRQESTLLYSYGLLWEVDHQDENGNLVWRPLKPVVPEHCAR